MESRKVLHFVVQVSWIQTVRTRSSHEDLSNRGASSAGDWMWRCCSQWRIFTGKKNGRKMSSVTLGDVFF